MPTNDSISLTAPGETTISSRLSPGIHRHPTQQSWLLVTEGSSYALGVTEEGLVLQLYWGGPLFSFDDLPAATLPPAFGSQSPGHTMATEEYPAFGGLRYGEFAAKATFHDGTRDLDLRFASAEIADHYGLPELRVTLHDAVYPLEITLYYRVDTRNDLIIRFARFTNTGVEPVLLERLFSAVWHLPHQVAARRLTSLGGQWLRETRIQQRPLVVGTELLESRHGITGAGSYPWFAIDSVDPAHQEPQGETYFGTIAWSGNWLLRVTTTVWGATAIAGGIHDHDFAWQLAGGESFTTQDFVAGFAPDGLNGARHRLHRYVREHVLPRPQADRPRPVLYNSWEATLFDVTEEGQTLLAERAAQLGVELFVVDDGWFPGRNHDRAGLGDWSADAVKFPRGLQPLVDRVHALGMEFGLWVEPEMVNPDSELYRSHADWVYHFPNRPRSESRTQLVLNVGRTDVQAYLLERLDKIVSDHSIDFLKWDMNRPISEPGWPEYLAQGGEAREVWVHHTYGVYAIMDGLRARHPNLSIESCASGGSRADIGILRRTDQVWTSDNTHPDARLLIQEVTSLALPGRVMVAWVTDTPHDRVRNEIPLAFRFHVAMMGTLGVGGHLLHWSDEEMAEAARWIAEYKTIRPLVQDGDQSWLISPTAHNGTLAALQYVSPDKREAVVFAFRRANPFSERLPRLRLPHLDPEALYTLRTLGSDTGSTWTASGLSLQNLGLELPLASSSYASCIVHLQS